KSVVIPGELRLSNPIPSPVTVALPVVAWPHGPKNFWLGLLNLLAGSWCLVLAAIIPLGFVMTALDIQQIHVTLRGVLVSLLLLFVFPIALSRGIGLVGGAFTCFWDAVRSGP